MKALVYFQPSLESIEFEGARVRKNIKGAFEVNNIVYTTNVYDDYDVAYLMNVVDEKIIDIIKEKNVPVKKETKNTQAKETKKSSSKDSKSSTNSSNSPKDNSSEIIKTKTIEKTDKKTDKSKIVRNEEMINKLRVTIQNNVSDSMKDDQIGRASCRERV